jgi:hypothetical protein
MGKRLSADERALAALAENPFLSIADLMQAARVSSTCAIRVLRKHPPAPGAAVSAPATPPPRRRSYVLQARQARALVRQQLADGPRRGSEVEAAAMAAAIPRRSLLAATDFLGVRTQRGQWWLP